jgi:predicted  nucleic acid-binding Zn-ribbon protein
VSRSFEDLAAELYRLPPGEFTGRRNALAKELRGEDAALADQVAKLPKPGLAAWAVDVFAHERADQLAELLDLGAALREAQQELSRERMQALTAQAHELVSKVVGDVVDVATEAGTAVSGAARTQVEQTLRAAMADPDASDAVRAGLLAKPLEPGGFGAVDLTGAVAGAPKHVQPKRHRGGPVKDEAVQKAAEQAQRALREAEGKQQAAEKELDQAGEALAAAEEALATADDDLRRLREAVRDAERRQATAAADARHARHAQDKAAKRAEAARRRTEEARKEVEV